MPQGYIKSVSADPGILPSTFAALAGRIAGHSRASVYGHTPTPTANSDVWEGAGLYPFQSAATKLEILSASANDTAAGTGARTFTLAGLDTNFNQISEVLTMSGVTPVQTTLNYLRVNSLVIASAGSGNVNAGDVTLRVTGAGATQAIARAGFGTSKSGIFTVPSGFTLLVTDLLFGVGGVGNAASIIFSFTRIGPTGLIQTTNEYVSSPATPVQRTPAMGGSVPQQTTLTTRITTVTGAPVSGYSSFEGFLIDNTQLA